MPILGKLSKKLEPAGKVRIFAITDVGTQSALKPLHEMIFSILREIPQDGTFDQAAPLNSLCDKLKKGDHKWVASYDLSAATDRLPIRVQVQVLSQLLNNREVAEAWATLLTGRDWWLTTEEEGSELSIPLSLNTRREPFRYAVGQPMGALSSWGMLALTHHFLVQVAASRVGLKDGFEDYALLGDDIVIAHQGVANSYLHLMSEHLGVEINLSKSLVSDIGVMEFAKRLVGPEGELTPLGPRNILGVLKNPAYLPSLLIDFIGKGGDLEWQGVFSKFDSLSKQKDLIRLSKGGIEALKWTVLQPFGFISYPGLTAPEGLDNTLGEDQVDMYTLLEGIRIALAEMKEREEDSALEKSMDSVNKLRALVKSVHSTHSGKGAPLPPSFQGVVAEADRTLRSIAQRITNPEMPYINETGLTLGELLRQLLDQGPSVSPLDNVLGRQMTTKPRIQRVNLKFFKRVKLYVKALMMM